MAQLILFFMGQGQNGPVVEWVMARSLYLVLGRNINGKGGVLIKNASPAEVRNCMKRYGANRVPDSVAS